MSVQFQIHERRDRPWYSVDLKLASFSLIVVQLRTPAVLIAVLLRSLVFACFRVKGAIREEIEEGNHASIKGLP